MIMNEDLVQLEESALRLTVVTGWLVLVRGEHRWQLSCIFLLE